MTNCFILLALIYVNKIISERKCVSLENETMRRYNRKRVNARIIMSDEQISIV